MVNTLFQWILDIPKSLIPFVGWLTTTLPHLDITPLAILSIGGFTTIMILHVVHLVNVIAG